MQKNDNNFFEGFHMIGGNESVSKLRQLSIIAVVVAMFAVLCAFSAFAATAGWGSNSRGTKIYYYAESSGGQLQRAKGLYEIDGNYYYFTVRGLLQTGWISMSDGYRYFEEEGDIGEKGVMYEGGVRKIGVYYYGFDDDGRALEGFRKVGKYWYFFNKSDKLGKRGRAVTSRWKKVSGTGKVYFKATGKMARNEWVQNHTYYVTDEGTMLVSGVTPDGYLVGDDGKEVKKLENGWFELDGKYYFYNKTDKVIIKSKLFKYNGKYYYVDEDGVRQTGWQKIGNYIYYFYHNGGYAATGNTIIGDYSYNFTKKGRYVSSSAITAGWKSIGSKIYYYVKSSRGKMKRVKGLRKINGYYYYFSKDSSSAGELQTGLVKINGKEYYFRKSGSLGERGKGETKWVYISNRGYCYVNKGAIQKSQWIDDYYVMSNGAMNTRSNAIFSMVKKIVKSHTDESMTKLEKLRACFEYVCSSAFTYRVKRPFSYSANWRQEYAYEMLTTHIGVCYNFSSMFAYIARYCGYKNVRAVAGELLYLDGHWDLHSWTTIKIDGTTYVFDTSMEHGNGQGNFWYVTYSGTGRSYREWTL